MLCCHPIALIRDTQHVSVCGGHLPVCQRLDSHIVQWSARVHHRRDCLSVCPAGTYSAAGAASCTSICHGCVLSLVSCRVVAACACSVLLCGSVSGGSQLWRRHICSKHHRCARHINLATTQLCCCCSVSGRLLLCGWHDASQHHRLTRSPLNCIRTACAAGTYNALVNQSSSSACLGALGVAAAFDSGHACCCSVCGGQLFRAGRRGLHS